jgi:hypothetical protein
MNAQMQSERRLFLATDEVRTKVTLGAILTSSRRRRVPEKCGSCVAIGIV